MIFTRQTLPNAFRALVRLIRRTKGEDPILTTKVVEDERRRRCYDCPHRYFQQCSLCTCFISLKATLASEGCPDQPPRWKPQTLNSNGL